MNNNIKKNFEFIKVNIFIMWKRLLEFKSNFYSSLILETIYFMTILIFFNIIFNQFSNIIQWKLEDLIIYNIIIAILFSFSGFLIWKNTLFEILRSGNLNTYLLKPLNPLFFYIFYLLSPYALVFFIIDLIFFFVAYFYFNITFYNYFLSFFIFILILILNILLYLFFLSFDLLKMGLSEIFINPYNKINNLFENYPSIFFEKFFLKTILFIFPNFFVGTLFIPIIKNYNIPNLKFQLFLLISLILSLFFLIIFIWKIGLKKYSALG